MDSGGDHAGATRLLICPFSGQLITAATNTLTWKKSFDKAKSLADQYWRDYGAQIMSNIGCASRNAE
jgi:hypothetical protein